MCCCLHYSPILNPDVRKSLLTLNLNVLQSKATKVTGQVEVLGNIEFQQIRDQNDHLNLK